MKILTLSLEVLSPELNSSIGGGGGIFLIVVVVVAACAIFKLFLFKSLENVFCHLHFTKCYILKMWRVDLRSQRPMNGKGAMHRLSIDDHTFDFYKEPREDFYTMWPWQDVAKDAVNLQLLAAGLHQLASIFKDLDFSAKSVLTLKNFAESIDFELQRSAEEAAEVDEEPGIHKDFEYCYLCI